MSGIEDAQPPNKRPRKDPIPCPENDGWILLSQGAEARVWKVPNTRKDDDNNNNDASSTTSQQEDPPPFVIVKQRFSKAYRHPTLDERLTRQRCRMEGRILEKCGKPTSPLQHHVPKVLKVASPLLFLEYIDGVTVKQFINETTAAATGDVNSAAILKQVASEMGRLIGTLHSQAFVHGDLTTSNLLLVNNVSPTEPSTEIPFRLYLIDFGLAKPLNQQKQQQGKNSSNKVGQANMEEKAVDLYVLERALQSTHPQLRKSFWKALEASYVVATTTTDGTVGTPADQHPTLNRLEQVRQRGRKRECFG